MTAGREQDARETLRAAAVEAVARALDVEQGHRYGDDWLDEYRQEAEACADAVLALLPSPPATTGEASAGGER